jgi:hypothetical protein
MLVGLLSFGLGGPVSYCADLLLLPNTQMG